MQEAFFGLRILLAVLCVGFAASLGRSIARRDIIAARRAKPVSWAVRTALAYFALVFRTGFDIVAIVTAILSALAAGSLYVWEQRPKRVEEDLVDKMFDGPDR